MDPEPGRIDAGTAERSTNDAGTDDHRKAGAGTDERPAIDAETGEHPTTDAGTAEYLRVEGHSVVSVLARVLSDARSRGYRGWQAGRRRSRSSQVAGGVLASVIPDGLETPPADLASLVRAEERLHVEGVSRFAVARAGLHQLGSTTDGDDVDRSREPSDRTRSALDGASDAVDHAAEARSLVEWLLRNQPSGYAGFCAGTGRGPSVVGRPDDGPNLLDTSFAVEALLAAANLDPVYSSVAESASEFVVDELDYRQTDAGATVDCSPGAPEDAYVPAWDARAARLYSDLYAATSDRRYRERATELLDEVTQYQTNAGGWYVREPPATARWSQHYAHQALVVDALLRYRSVFDGDRHDGDRYDDALARALSFYERTLIDEDGAPRYDEISTVPRDVRAAASAIVVCARAGRLDRARSVLEWTFRCLYAGDGRFYCRSYDRVTVPLALTQWCQAWMAYALCEYVTAVTGGSSAVS